MKNKVLLSLAALCLIALPVRAGEHTFKGEVPLVITPEKHWEVFVETSQMFNCDGNHNDYYFMTQMLSLAYEPFRPFQFGPIKVRAQLIATFYGSAILRGPETYYFGGGPQIRLIFPIADSRWSLYGTFGSGAGLADAHPSAKNDHGLGQPFTFILLANGGLRYAMNGEWSVWGGFMWHHLSNCQLSLATKANTGPDEIGFVMGAGYAF